MSEFIQHEPHDETVWICLCDNTPCTDAFATCATNGEDMEPSMGSDWDGLYRCDRCYRIIDQSDRRVVGMAPQRYRLDWQGIEIEARYWPIKWGAIAHLEIESVAPERAPLPISATGYRSHFHQPGTIEANGGAVVA
ncbi:hypothetical protein RN629_15425 [Sphingomonadaceae bacterium jetA1]|jgi:hypothetical protein|uniref:hypothetical protein n=1 Tax=Facivitalis istanbulensis TaxID=3075838 RepID=UPI0034781959